MTKLVVITGGPYSGKTTLVNAFARLGYHTVPEAAIAVIAELTERMGLEQQKRWRHDNRAEFQSMILARQIAAEEDALRDAEGSVIFDRSRIDGLAYCRHFGAAPPDELVRAAGGIRFHHVLLLDTLQRVEVRTETGRTSDRATSLALRDQLDAVYRELGYAPVLIPEVPVRERVKLAQAAIGAYGSKPS